MDERHNKLGAVLADVRRRWTRRTRLVAWTAGASAAAMVLAVGMLAVWLVAPQGIPLALVTLAVTALAVVTIACAAWPLRHPPSDAQLARYIEEQAGGLDDVVVTAVAHGDERTPVAGSLAAQAADAVERAGTDRLVPQATLRRAAIGAIVATLALAVASTAFAPTAGRGASIAAAYLLPSRITFDVSPGTTRLRAEEPITITARIRGVEPGLVPSLVAGRDDESITRRMETTGIEGEYAMTFDRVSASFVYHVVAGPAQSDEFAIEVIRPARVTRVDLQYHYPRALGLEPRTEEDGGDIYGPKGTTVEIAITTDKPVTAGALTLADGTELPLGGRDQTRTASLNINGDGAYRIALTDVDGLVNPGETEYFIRMLDDRPPAVRVMRPGGDKQVTPIEEVLIEARADDDFGLASFELVFQAPGRDDTVVGFPTGRQLAVSASHMVHLEDLGVRPGQFITYYVRARDVGQGRRGTEARSDIYFLEVKPFEEVFVAAQSQSMGRQGGAQGLMELAEAQKEIIAATWKLDARARRGRDQRSEADIKAVGRAQAALGARAADAAGGLAGAVSDPRRRRPRPGMSAAPGGEDPIARAVEAMGRAAGELDRARTSQALPHEMEALERLLEADADVKRRQVAQQQAGGGSGSNRQSPDLSTLFDQQLRKQQQTNYETPDSTETREEKAAEDDPLERIRELARRQEGLQREQRDLAQNRDRLSREEIERHLERLTREQQQLTEQADELSRQLQQSSRNASNQQEPSESSRSQQSSSLSGAQGQRGGSGSQSSRSRQMREIAEQMKNAASDLRRQDPQQASAHSGEAVEQLRDLSREIERASPDERRRAMGDLQFEARQLADAERRLASEAERAASGPAGEDTRRRLSAEQERLADRTARLAETAREMAAPGGTGDEQDADARRAASDAARAMEADRLAERMRENASALRKPDPGARPAEEGREMARALDRVAGTLGDGSGSRDQETRRLSEELARTGELRDRVSELQRTLQELDQQAREGQQGGRPSSDAQGQPSAGRGQASAQPSPSAGQESEGREGSSGEQGGADGGRAGRVARLQRDAAEQMREAQRLARELGQENPEMKDGGRTPEDWWPSISAPGTEAFKQDFSKWEALRKNLLLALERTETRLSSQLRERETRERLNAGGHEGVAEAYREMVDRYYQSLAAPRKPR